MRFIADLHIHSYLSRATSKDLNLEQLHRTAQRKGISIVATGDFTHPRWFAELRSKLVPAEAGLFALRDDLARDTSTDLPAACRAPVRFMLSVEISSIYKSGGKVRKVHNLVYVPDFEAAARLSTRLCRIGNIESDGRPILGLDSRDLLEIVLESSPDAYLVPAHIWTPWFSALGAQSGFDAIDECFRDLSGHIFAVETGLSSDPAMNWRLSALDRFTLVSNSDAHSAEKLGREANLFDCDLSYFAVRDALACRHQDFLGTIEFFPEEGKYHLDGHRKCGVVLSPAESRRQDGLCPTCGKRLTSGVMGRVAELADRPEGYKPEQAKPFRSMVPLAEVIGEVLDAGAASNKVRQAYDRLLARVGPEMTVLSHAPFEDLAREGPPLLAEALRRIREGQVHVLPGYDGEYGIVRAFGGEELKKLLAQKSFAFALTGGDERVGPAAGAQPRASSIGAIDATAGDATAGDATAGDATMGGAPTKTNVPGPDLEASSRAGGWLNPEQAQAVMHGEGPLLLVAGPGTGKTWTVVQRIAHLVRTGRASARAVRAITFTRKAAEELGGRLAAVLPSRSEQIGATTFHAWALVLLRAFPEEASLPSDFAVVDETRRLRLVELAEERAPSQRRAPAGLADRIGLAKAHLLSPSEADPEIAESYAAYERALRAEGAIDFDDLVLYAVRLLEKSDHALTFAHERCRWLFVDEYQDINAAQHRFVRVLSPGSANLCAVGDPDQSIYGFRGSNPSYFDRFEQDYPGAVAIRLVRNYRSAAPIVGAATAVIERSPGRSVRPLEPLAGASVPVERFVVERHEDEAELIAQMIERAVGGTSLEAMHAAQADAVMRTLAFREIAVLVRTSAQMEPMAAALTSANIPFHRAGDDALTVRPRVSELLARLRALAKNRDLGLVADVAGLPPDLGRRSVSELSARLGALGGDDASWKAAAELCAVLALPFGNDVEAFLEALPLLRESDVRLDAQKVALLTIHASKGLEFPLVFVAGCEDGLLPLRLFGRSTNFDEERRLLYVGMTRAKERLVLTSARKRSLLGRSLANAGCPFLQGLPPHHFIEKEMPARRKNRQQLSLF